MTLLPTVLSRGCPEAVIICLLFSLQPLSLTTYTTFKNSIYLFYSQTQSEPQTSTKTEAVTTKISFSALAVIALIWLWKLLNWLWLKPKKLERILKQQGLQATPYRILFGDSKEIYQKQMEAKSKPLNPSDDIAPSVSAFVHQTVNKYGKNSFIWFGPIPRVIITDPEQIKDIFNKIYDFPKPPTNPLARFLVSGLPSYEGEKWAKHRKLINPAFHLEKLKIMLPIFFQSCNDLISEWEGMLSSNGSSDMDIWPSLQNMTSDVISRTSFGSSYEEGIRIFQLLKEQTELTMRALMSVYIPGYMFLPTSSNRRMKELDRDIIASLKGIINKREKALTAGEATTNDLLGILLQSNHKEIEDHGNKKNVGMSLQDVIDECKLFYFAGQETTSSLLVWTMVLLSMHSNWQTHAREEVFHVFGEQKPDFDGLSHLKIMAMILHEVLRLYPPVPGFIRTTHKDIQLGKLKLPAGVQVSLPAILIHHDHELWGDDAKEFNPERFSDGISKATNGQVSYFPFGWGPRICIGQNFALLEAKMALAMILQHFSFDLSPNYTHAPTPILTLQPQYGANVILHKLKI